MNKNTGDGELPSIHANSIKGLDCPACGHPCLMLMNGYITCTLAECPNPDFAEAIAQEANKAQQKLLQELIRQWQQFNEYDPETLSNVPVNAVRLEVIQNKLEGLS